MSVGSDADGNGMAIKGAIVIALEADVGQRTRVGVARRKHQALAVMDGSATIARPMISMMSQENGKRVKVGAERD
jgi:hypothetical protein